MELTIFINGNSVSKSVDGVNGEIFPAFYGTLIYLDAYYRISIFTKCNVAILCWAISIIILIPLIQTLRNAFFYRSKFQFDYHSHFNKLHINGIYG